MLILNNLTISHNSHLIIKNCSLTAQSGSVHIIMGPNGSGKSSLITTIMGHPAYAVDQGNITFNGNDLLPLAINQRARIGIFLGFQQPLSIPGVTVFNFFKEALQACKQTPLSEIKQLIEQALSMVGLDHSYAQRYLNDGFSGGEKKRLELAQCILLQPQVAMLDEIDSGLDADGIEHVINCITDMRQKSPTTIWLIVTHNTQLAQRLSPDAVHILNRGTLINSGDQALINTIQTQGYDGFAIL